MAAQPQLWRLDATDTTLLLYAQTSQCIPEIIWLGSKLNDNADPATVASISNLPLPLAKLDAAVPQTLFPQASTGLDISPALRGHRNGHAFAQCFITEEVTQTKDTLLIKLADTHAGLSIELALQLHEATSVLSITTTLCNTSNTPYTTDWLASASIPLPEQFTECMYLTGRWGLEFQRQRQPLTDATLLLENTRGRTSHELYPGVITGDSGFSEQQGTVIAAVLAWSGSHRTTIEQLGDGRRALQCGVALDPGELVLASGEAYTTPTLYIACGNGLNQISQSMHRYMRAEILPSWTRTPRPIHANSWEALYFDHNIDKLKALIDASAKLGAERFVLDDGWFQARRGDNAGLGDWWVDLSVYPDGLHPIVNHVRSAGLQFGLWFEPEMVNPDSELYRQHPDWVLQLNPNDTPLARNQLVLNMDKQEVQNYLFDHISRLIEEYKVDYIKWDFNRDLVMAGDGNQSRMQKQPIGSYQLMARLNAQHTTLEIESCSSGGARADWGVLQHTGRVWTSDSIDAIDRVAIQSGYGLFHPPEIMGAHIGHEEAHLTGRSIDIHTRAIVALQGQFGFEVDARHVTDEESEQLQHYVALYKKHRAWISESTLWRQDAGVSDLSTSGLVSEDKGQSLWFVIATASLQKTACGKLHPCGLDADRQYRVSLASNNYSHFETFSKQVPTWLSANTEVNGDMLMKVGLTLPIMPAHSALLLEISAL